MGALPVALRRSLPVPRRRLDARELLDQTLTYLQNRTKHWLKYVSNTQTPRADADVLENGAVRIKGRSHHLR